MHNHAARLLLGSQVHLHAGEVKMLRLLDALHAHFIQFLRDGFVGFPCNVLTEDEPDDFRILWNQQPFFSLPAIPEHFWWECTLPFLNFF
jgi:hypothetical protein